MKFSKLTKEEKLNKIADLTKGMFKGVAKPPSQVDWTSPYQVYVHYYPEEKDCYKWLQILRNHLKKIFYVDYDVKLVEMIKAVATDQNIKDHKGALLDRCKDPLKYMN